MEIRLDARTNLAGFISYFQVQISSPQSDADIKSQLFNLIAQADNQQNIRVSRVMRQIAVKTKKDGSTMKLIAVLGTIFLPTTLVSVRVPTETKL